MNKWNMEYYNSLDKGEQRLVDWQFDLSGGFYTSLFVAISRADGENMARLEAGFPEEVKAFKRYRDEEWYWPNIMSKLRSSQ